MAQNVCYYCMSFTGGRDPCPACHSRADYGNPPPALRAGTVLAGQYLVGRCLGRGGFGITYLGLDNLQRKVVIKEFFPKKIAKRGPGETAIQPGSAEMADSYEQGIQTFLNEAITLAKFDDPNIGKIYYSFRENNAAYFVAPYKEGATLDEFTRRQPGGLSEDKLLEIVREVLCGLERVHQAGIIHRDIKPSNIFLPNKGRPFLIDFGNARHYTGASHLTVFLTHGYAPLEQYSENLKEGKQGPWSDIYSCAATMYACLRGGRAESGGVLPPPSAPDRVAGAKLPSIEQVTRRAISPRIAAAIMRGLELSPQKRPQSVAEFRALLEGAAPAPAPRGWALLCLAGEFAGERFALSAQPLVIGRSSRQCNLVLADTPDNRGVSRRHCQVWVENSRVMVQDLNSKLGTLLNDLEAMEPGRPRALNLRDYISLAGNVVFAVVGAEEAQQAPARPAGGEEPRREGDGDTMSTDKSGQGAVHRFLKKVLFH
ncbi:MAG: FHA domain-containing serine/threonine-protein kinase [Thermodesulfobacteriota bacterium]